MSTLTLIILSVALIGMVCMPLILTNIKQKRKSNLLRERLKSEFNLQDLKASDFETWRETYCIGLDQKNKQLLFLNTLENEVLVQKIDLKQVSFCKPIRKFREIKKGKEKSQIISKVTLELDQFDEHKKPFIIELFDEEKSDYLINEWELAQTWSKKVNDMRN